MQPHLDKQSAINSKLSTTAATTTRRETPEQQHQQQPQPEPQPHSQPPQRSKVKVIKSKRPLCHFKFYLDIRDHQLTKRIESEIKALGGNLEFFLNDSITHFITDKERSITSSAVAAVVAPNSRSQHQQQRPATPLTPATPNTPQSQSLASATIGNEDGCCSTSYPRKVRQTRADAILSRVREAQQQSQPSPLRGAIELTHQQPPGKSLSYVVWQTEYALRFFRRIQTELRQYLQEGAVTTTTTAAGTANILLKGNYIKIESIKRNHRPYYHLLKQPEEWPKIDLSSDDGAFRLQAKAKLLEQSMTRKSLGSRTSQRQQEKHKEQQTLPQQPQLVVLQHSALQACKKQTESPDRSHCRELKESSDKQCGVCEICKIEYDTLSIHLQSKDHELFAKNSGNFVALDTLIEVSASVKGFLQREAEQEQKEREQQQQQQKIFTDMEVDELLSDSALALSLKAAINQTDADALQQTLSSGNNNNSNRQRPSPVLREKSKRITKGKHSSEKFQATTPNNSPTAAAAATTSNPAPVAASKKGTTTTSCNLLELHASNATTTAATPTNPTRRKTNNSVLSPPIRAMLPPSSLYKVVEASDATATPPRVRRGGVNNATTNLDSPSLIVKFQKVRQSELQRLNGEAENFMFPRSNTATTRSSSELLTDVDRQTTSDVVRGGQHSVSSSTNSTNDSTSEEQLDAALAAGAGAATTPALVQGRAAVVGRRRKGVAAAQQLLRQLSTGSTSSSNGSNNQHQQQQQQQQRFPNAPIQPEMQPLKQPRQAAAATRKSSRMATAIVTAATTSSQLQLRRQRGGNKLEDRMGEQQQPQQEQTTTNHKKLIAAQQQQKEEEQMEVEIEEDVEEMMMSHDESSCSSGSDEDYVASSKLHKSLPATSQRAADTREERAARRLSRLTLSTSRNELQRATPLKCGRRGKQKLNAVKNSKLNKPQLITAAATTTTTPATPTAATSPAKKTAAAAATSPSSEQMFDCSKSVRLQRMRYAFETSPSAELWHHVFQRQDAGEEHYYSYYGSTRYRKLPYEMGPIPMERTKPHSCSICQQQQQQQQQQVDCKPQALLQPIKLERDVETDSNQTAATTTTTTTSSMYKHKKLHLLQRYQQEQQQQQTQLNNIAVPIAKCDSKASTPELLERDFAPLSERGQLVERVRAASTQSSTSSTSCSQKSSSINKQLARVVDLPPRKSPREHASTLALVSCIIRQRQDSQSKTNSEAEEPPPTTTTAPPPPVAVKKPIKQELVEAVTPHKTRSQAATPVEELRFATEISETVKRMRRGQNKYDSVPTPTTPAAERTTPARCRRPANNNNNNNNEVNMANTLSYSRRTTTTTTTTASTLLGKRKRRQLGMKTTGGRGTLSGQQQQQQSHQQLLPGIRKLPSKKGLLEYEMEGSALKALDASMQYVSPMLIAWQIDKYLELTGRDYDLPVDDEVQLEQQQQQQPESNVELRDDVVQTPPPTDCFTSEFDLCDLLAGSGGSGDDDEFAVRTGCRRNSRLNLFSSYQRKRKCLKSNRTGWPRVQRRRAARSLPHNDDAPINFHELGVFDDAKQQQRVKQEPLEMEEEQTTTTATTTTTTTTSTTKVAEKEINKEQDDDDNDESAAHGKGDGDDDDGEQNAREDVVMTPPATDVDEQLGNDDEEVEAEEEEAEEAAAASDEDDDDETMADSVEEQQNDEAEIEATDADVEEDEDEEEDEEQDEQEDEPEEEEDDEEEQEEEEEDVYEDAYGDEEVSTTTTTHEQQLTLQNLSKSRLKSKSPTTKRDSLAKTAEQSPAKEEQPLLTLQTSNGFCLNVTTSTPSTRQPRHRTPQLNGSLGSCISPSEKLGDNSDIFTVSSDGLETDMDLSNTQAGDSLEHCQHQHQHLTPTKHKFDISKYAPPNNGKAASSCAAEAATAAVKSLAISQFLKKEVRVTCRRLRAPFRRFRYRR